MTAIQDQFSYELLPDYFEKDTHLDIQELAIDRLHVLNGESAHDSILLVLYKGSPVLSFYDARGRLIDVDHYLPDNYRLQDVLGADSLISNLKNIDVNKLKFKANFQSLFQETLGAGKQELAAGLRKKLGFETLDVIVQQFKTAHNLSGSDKDLGPQLEKRFPHFYAFLEALILFQQKLRHGYVHITPKDNIVITPLNKRSGISVMLETKAPGGHLLPPNKWLITRTKDQNELEQALVFRSKDIQQFFKAEGLERVFETDRYKLYHTPEKVEIDSLLDNTDNLLKLKAINNCFQILPSDNNIVLVLSQQREVTVVNTHRSVVPHKWPRKIVLQEAVAWIRGDENLTTLFAQNAEGDIMVYDVTGEHAQLIQRFQGYTIGFELDQAGSLLLVGKDNNQLQRINTNVNELDVPTEQKTLVGIMKNISHLFKGESLFVKTQFARVVTEIEAPEVKKLPTAFEVAQYDFETNVDHMLSEAGSDYEALLDVQNKIAIARQNIAEQLSTHADKEGVFLGGQRLQKAVNNIIRPAEQKVRNLVEQARSVVILQESQAFRRQVAKLREPGAYREILNTVRQFEDELHAMLPENNAAMLGEFKAIKQELDLTFSEQIASDGTALQGFITGEIQQIETAIKNTHDPRQLEMLLSTHPAALELMSLLKQPFILQNIAKERALSPAGIQKRLYDAVGARKEELHQELKRQEAEKSAAKLQLANMIRESIDFFTENHSGGFSDLELSGNANYRQILGDITKLESAFSDVRLAIDLRRKLERRILERNRADLEKMVIYEGKYAFIQNDPDLYIDLESTIRKFPKWELQLMEKQTANGTYYITFKRDTDQQVYHPSVKENLKAGKAFELREEEYQDFAVTYEQYCHEENSYELIQALWEIAQQRKEAPNYPQFEQGRLNDLAPGDLLEQKALRCALEKKAREYEERNRQRNVPIISPEFIDDTPYFQEKLMEFVIKAKLQLVSGTGILLLSGPPSTGKSAFLKFIAALMNREYFEHSADKWQTKNSLVTAIKFGAHGPYATPAGFTRAITTSYSLVNIEEIKEWPEALRKSLNPFFAGSKDFIAPDGTRYQIGDNLLLCAAANLGSMYRQNDEPFTADFWSRIEVIEFDYAPDVVDRNYYAQLHYPLDLGLLTLQDLVNHFFYKKHAPKGTKAKAIYYARNFIEFLLLPKADEAVKRSNLGNYIRQYFEAPEETGETYNPEEAAKIALRRLKDFHGYSPQEFFDFYDHFVNGENLRSRRLAQLQTADTERYEQLKFLILCLYYIEGCLRQLRVQFTSSAGQTEIEGTNREFIKCVYLLSLLGKS